MRLRTRSAVQIRRRPLWCKCKAQLRDCDHAAEREKTKEEIAALEERADSPQGRITNLDKASKPAQLELADLKVRLGEMQATLKAKAEALEEAKQMVEAAEHEARSHVQRSEILEIETAAALQEARDDKGKFKGKVNAHNNEELKKIEDTLKMKLVAEQAASERGTQ